MERTRTVFFGSGSFAVPVLARLSDAGPAGTVPVEVVAVVTAPPRPAGRSGELRPTPIAVLAGTQHLPVLTPATLRDEGALAELRAAGPELIVLADYGRLIPPAVLALPRHGALNLHPSLLPRHRGASPIPAAILAGDEHTGVTLMRMDEGMDSGPILAQREITLEGNEVAPELETMLAGVAADLLVEVLPAWLDGSLQAWPQPDEGVTMTRPLRRADGALDAMRMAVELERQVRALPALAGLLHRGRWRAPHRLAGQRPARLGWRPVGQTRACGRFTGVGDVVRPSETRRGATGREAAHERGRVPPWQAPLVGRSLERPPTASASKDHRRARPRREVTLSAR